MNAEARNDFLLNDLELASFHRDGYLIRRGLAATEIYQEILQVAKTQLAGQWAPVEFEVDVQYPGSPASHQAAGGNTVRRLLHAYTRDAAFRSWATSAAVKETLQQLFQAEQVMLSQCHHNCVMTKQPGYSSATLWHQDNRYWSFDEENLISVWLGLGHENQSNGCLRVIPGTHKMSFEPGRFDAALFLRPDLKENKALMAQAVEVHLEPGDVLFFHSRLFHAAGRNLSDEIKYSMVFTYHLAENHPITETRSARFPSVPL